MVQVQKKHVCCVQKALSFTRKFVDSLSPLSCLYSTSRYCLLKSIFGYNPDLIWACGSSIKFPRPWHLFDHPFYNRFSASDLVWSKINNPWLKIKRFQFLKSASRIRTTLIQHVNILMPWIDHIAWSFSTLLKNLKTLKIFSIVLVM